ncbi:MAG TPA: FAD-binding protein [Pyrinomonadaceae bacterium]
MKRVVSGRVLSTTDNRPVLGAVVELSGENFETRRMTTNREGAFRFDLLGNPGNLRVLDRRGTALSNIANLSGEEVEIVVATSGAEQLPRQPTSEKLIGREVFDTIRLAASRFATHPNAARRVINEMFCRLPPVLQMPELVHVAEGVLRGHGADVVAFRSLLDDLEIWNRGAFSYVRPSLTSKEADKVLSPAFLRTLVPDPPPKFEPVLSRQIVAVTLVAAMRVAGSNTVGMNRNIGILLEQFSACDALISLYRKAREATSGGAIERQAFLSRMQIFAPVCEDVPDKPEPPSLPDPPGPSDGPPWSLPDRPRPSDGPPWPLPGRPWSLPGKPGPDDGPPWPPSPEGPDPSWGRDPCEPEIILAFREFLGRRRFYSIDSISPPGACPGDVLTITGSGFIFEGSTGVVNFPTAVSGSFIPAEPLDGEWTDTLIRVKVPEGACDGFLDLEIPGGADTMLVCDVVLDLFIAAVDPAEFVGGRTHLLHFSASTDACLNAGDVVTFSWQGCNINHAEIFIRDSLGSDIATIVVLDGMTRYPARYVAPAFDRSMVLTARIEVFGPCGIDAMETVITVRRGLSLPGPDPFEPVGGSFENFLRNIHRDDLEVAHIRPEEGRSALEMLLKALEVTEAAGDRLGVRGSGCSYTDIVVPVGTTRRMINPDGMFATNQDLNPSLPGLPLPERSSPPAAVVKVLERGLRDDLSDEHSILSSEVLDAYRAVGPVSPLVDRLVHVEAGIKLERLVCLLDRLFLSMPTLGGGVPQSIAGAISTGTHGSTVRLPPIADFIRAVHLVGPGGEQWWLEPASSRITDPNRMSVLKREGILDPCLRVRYDDELFNAVLVSFGTAGIIYSVIIETIDTQVYRGQTSQPSWERAREILRTTVLEPLVPEPWFFEITMDPTGRLRLTTLELIPPSTPPSEDMESELRELREALLEVLAGLPVRLLLELPLYVARQALGLLNPFEAISIFRRIGEVVDMVREIIQLVRDLPDLRFDSPEAWARALPNAINLIWHLGDFMGIGRTVFDELQNLFTENERPSGTFVRSSWRALNLTTKVCPDTLPENVRRFDDPVRRLIRSSEYIVPADQLIAFTDAIRAVANDVRSGPNALILVINLRLTQRTRALVGMQQFPFNGHVELFTVQGLNGNEEFESLLQPVVERFRAIPHWGQLHSRWTNYTTLYGERLRWWRNAINTLSEDSETPNTFRHDFARSRGLLSDL